MNTIKNTNIVEYGCSFQGSLLKWSFEVFVKIPETDAKKIVFMIEFSVGYRNQNGMRMAFAEKYFYAKICKRNWRECDRTYWF